MKRLLTYLLLAGALYGSYRLATRPSAAMVAANAEWEAAVEAERRGPPAVLPPYQVEHLREVVERRHWDREIRDGLRCSWCKWLGHTWESCVMNPKVAGHVVDFCFDRRSR